MADTPYHGITQDERTALRHIFDNSGEELDLGEQFSDIQLASGST